jgi:hypothetical protein
MNLVALPTLPSPEMKRIARIDRSTGEGWL